MKLNWKLAFSFHRQDPNWRSKLFLGGLFIILLPPVGWLLALGYRKETAIRLVEGLEPVLPAWGDRTGSLFIAGVKAAAVILIYYVPFFAIFWLLGVADLETARTHGIEIVAFFLLLPVLIPICVLLLPPLYWWWFSWIEFSNPEMAIIGCVFWGTAFLLPAAFVRVSLTGRFRSALELRAVLAFVRNFPRLYVEAWLISLLASAIGILMLPLSPWGIFWSYLAILFAFNNALVASCQPEIAARFARSKLLHPNDVHGRDPI